MTRWMWVVLGVVACDGGAGKEGDTDTDGETDAEASLVNVIEDLPGALLSITGRTASDVWTVGADAGEGPEVLRWDGSSWSKLDTSSVRGDLWWIFLAGADDVWMAGAGGRVVHHVPSTGTLDAEVLEAGFTIYGIWGSGPDDVYAVGGRPDSGGNAARVWHYDGDAWSALELPAGAASQAAMYKVWGTAADDVWVCGMAGVLLHFDGAAWTLVSSGGTRDLFTLHGNSASEAWVVGGTGNGTILRWDGAAWTDESPDFSLDLRGVFAAGDRVVAAGRQGSLWWRGDDGAWTVDEREIATFKDYHAVWQDPDGGVWSVGGQISSFPLSEGVLTYGGDAPPAVYSDEG